MIAGKSVLWAQQIFIVVTQNRAVVGEKKVILSMECAERLPITLLTICIAAATILAIHNIKITAVEVFQSVSGGMTLRTSLLTWVNDQKANL